MICLNCDKQMVEGPVTLSGEFRGEHFSVAMQGFRCPQCEYSTIHGRNSADFSRRLADAYRSRHGLLTSDEIKAARARVGKSQPEFAVYLRVGVASVKRWESGQVQDAAMDELIRLKTDLWAAEQNVSLVRGALSVEQPFDASLTFGSLEAPAFLHFVEVKNYSQHAELDIVAFSDVIWVEGGTGTILPVVRNKNREEEDQLSRSEELVA
jgi:putative zinc finger/helix-turn-helix YgiT family protein